jgi:hypothetical protein
MGASARVGTKDLELPAAWCGVDVVTWPRKESIRLSANKNGHDEPSSPHRWSGTVHSEAMYTA